MMTSFIQTMFVPCSPARSHFPPAAKPLLPLQCNVLAASQSHIHLPCSTTQSLTSEFPLHKQFRGVIAQAAKACLFDTADTLASLAPSQHPSPTKQPRPLDIGLGRGFDAIDSHADMIPCDSNNKPGRPKAAFRPQETQKGTNSWQLKQFAEATLGSGSLRKVVKLPEGEDLDEWLAVNVVDFYNQINLLYGAITEFCSPQTCPEMKATDEFEYLWHLPPDYPKPTRLAAPKYISHLLTWVSNLTSDTELFPTAPGVPFPAHFQSNVRQMFKRMYRIYAHIYCHHYSVVRGLGLEPHLNTGFKHYVLFVDEFGLANEGGATTSAAQQKKARAEWFGPLGVLVESMLNSD